jgi:hypothetical protein
MNRNWLVLALFLAGCSKGPEADLQYIKQARSLGAEWALINEQVRAREVTATYADSMHQWVRDGLQTASSALTEPDSPYGREMQALMREPPNAGPDALRAHVQALKQIEDKLESA